MKRTLKYALSAVLGAALVIPALAQDQFPDVPANHWAYKDLLEMKQNGLLVGYPDGLFRGGRPASRYELAVACHAVWANLKAQQDALKSQMDDLARRMDGVATKADLDALKAQLDALSAEVNRIKSEDIARLNRLLDEFRGELTRMGADVNQMKSDIKAIGDRLTKVEARLPNFDVTGDLTGIGIGGYSSSHRNGITVDGRPTGVGRGSYTGTTVGATRDLTALHEGAFTIKSHNEDPKAVKFRATGVFGNALGFNNVTSNLVSPRISAYNVGGFGSQSWVYPGAPFMEGDESFYVQEAYLKWDTSIGGLKFNAEVGRVGYEVSPWLFKRPDVTPYYREHYWDDGKWRFDGGILGFNFGKARLDVFGGRESSLTNSSGELFQPLFTGHNAFQFTPGDSERPRGYERMDFLIDQLLGANLVIPLSGATRPDHHSDEHMGGKEGEKHEDGEGYRKPYDRLYLSYIMLDSNDVINLGTSVAPKLANGVNVFGVGAIKHFGNLEFQTGYYKSDERYNGRTVVSKNDAAWNIGLDYRGDRWGLGASYERIEPLFSAPGDWGRIGIWWNPTDIEGFKVQAHYRVSPRLELSARGAWYTGTDSTDRFGDTGLSTDDKLGTILLGLAYHLCRDTRLCLSYEDVCWDLANRPSLEFAGGKPKERWYGIGLDRDLGNRARLSILWQVSDYNGKNVDGFNPFFFGNNTRATGGIITTQLSIRF